MYLRILTLLSLFSALILSSCSPEHSEIVLAEYGDYEIKMKEFEDVYAKNAGSLEQAKLDSLNKKKNFLDLYVNFKMKLRDAQVRGFEKDPALEAELTDYKKKVGVTYLLEKKIVEPGVADLAERRKSELRISHIMIRPDTSGIEGAKVKANSILDSIKSGKSFEEMAQKYSHDTFSAPTGGDIFYITAGQVPPEFEDAAYSLNPGEVYPEVVETRYGIHIIKVTEKQERVSEIQASHILIDFNNAEGTLDSLAARATADSILAQLREGADFAELANKYTEDPSNGDKGGDLGYFSRRMMVKEFDEAAFALKTGEISDIVKTNFGYHIIKVTDRKIADNSDSGEKEEIKKIFKQTRYQALYDHLIDSLKQKYSFQLNSANLAAIAEKSDSVKVGGNYPSLDQLKDQSLFTFSGNNVTYGDFYEKMNSNNEFANKLLSYDLLTQAASKISAEYLLEQEALNLEKSNPEFASLMNDYKSGIFIFKLQEEEVWNKIEVDSVKLYDYYVANKDSYRFPDRVNFSEIFSRKDSLINDYYTQLKNGVNFDTLASKHTERPGFKEKQGNHGLVEATSSIMSKKAAALKPGEYSEPFVNANGKSIVRLNYIDEARLKTFEEAKAEVSGAYQEAESKRLEKAYIDKLEKKYEPEVYYEKLEEVYEGE